MTDDGQDRRQPPQYPGQGYGQRYPQEQPWQPEHRDPRAQQPPPGYWPPRGPVPPPVTPPQWGGPQHREPLRPRATPGARRPAAPQPQPRPPAQPAPKPQAPAAPGAAAPKKDSPSPKAWGCCLGVVLVPAALVTWLVVASGSGGSGGTAAAPATPSAPVTCAAQLASWAGTGEGTQLTAFSTDIGTFGDSMGALAGDAQAGDATAGDLSAVQSAAAVMQSDAQALEASPGPSCVPGLADNLYDAARDYSAAAGGASSAITELAGGDEGAATGDLDKAAKAEDKGNAKITAADKALKSYEASYKAKTAPRTTHTAAAPSQTAAPAAPAQTTQAAAPAPPASAAPASCYPLTDGGNCYEPGEYCRDSDHGMSGVAGDGEAIICQDNDGWRWEPA